MSGAKHDSAFPGTALNTLERVTLPAPPLANSNESRTRVANRYRVLRELGRGGMATVFCVFDEVLAREVALKQLTAQGDSVVLLTRLFEREYQVLQQLSHPRVIQVFDYGVEVSGPYYTMELLDGGDLRERAPLPWVAACEIAFDICSALALLHSRRLVHRDVSPRNIRCTRADEAKLIDFGAMTPMGPSAQLVGTPGFMAPEVLHRTSLDARTDLYSLGATLYFALTGKLAYNPRQASELLAASRTTPTAPSQHVSGVPARLDELVLSLLHHEPELRPRNAYEVMQRLCAIAGLERSEPLSVSHAYLATPALVGREHALSSFRRSMRRALHWRGGGLLITAPAGLGRSRLLDACVLEAKTLGATVLHVATKTLDRTPFGVTAALADQLLALAPERARQEAEANADCSLPLTAAGSIDRSQLPAGEIERRVQQSRFANWFVGLSESQPLLIAIDDVDRADAATLAVLGMLADRGRRHRLLVAASCERSQDSALPGLAVLAQRSRSLGLRPLEPAQTQELLRSVFGEVDHLLALSTRIHTLAHGVPRECMALAKHLVDHGRVRYTAGNWTLPASLSSDDLPASLEALLAARVFALQPAARSLAASVALAADMVFARIELAQLCQELAPDQPAERVIQDLLSAEVLVSDGQAYVLSNPGLCGPLLSELSAEQRTARYRALAELFEHHQRSSFARIKYLFAAGLPGRALDSLLAYTHDRREVGEFVAGSQMQVLEVGRTLLLALESALKLQRPLAEVCQLRRWVISFGIGADEDLYPLAAPELLQQLLHDSGMVYLAGPGPHSLEQVFAALQRAAGVYAQTAEHERAYSVEEAIKQLAYFVAVSIAIASRCFDAELARRLAPLIEPLAPLSPLLHAMWQNALAFCESTFSRQPERARSRWAEVYQRLLAPECATLPSVDVIRNAVAFGIGLSEAQLGLPSVLEWASRLDADVLQRVNAIYLRRLYALHHGDADAADRHRREAELLEVQSTVPQMFNNILAVELQIYAAARDMSAVKQVLDRLTTLSERLPLWLPYRYLGEAQLHRLNGDFERARAACERALAQASPHSSDPRQSYAAWPPSAGLQTEVLLELGESQHAREFAEAALRRCSELEIDFPAHDLVRALALAEAKCGEYEAGAARLEALLEKQRALGVSGLHLGMTCEARARVAIWARDPVAVLRYGAAASHEYRYGQGSMLGLRYVRLMQEARRADIDVLEATGLAGVPAQGGLNFDALCTSVYDSVRDAMNAEPTSQGRAERALWLLCDAYAAGDGHLFLLRASGLQLVASRSLQPADERLQPFLSGVLNMREHVVTGDIAPTMTEFVDNPRASVWTNAAGVAFDVVVLTTGANEDSVTVGVAALQLHGRKPKHPLALHVAHGVARHLLHAGL